MRGDFNEADACSDKGTFIDTQWIGHDFVANIISNSRSLSYRTLLLLMKISCESSIKYACIFINIKIYSSLLKTISFQYNDP